MTPAASNPGDKSAQRQPAPWVVFLAVLVPSFLYPNPGHETTPRVVTAMTVAVLVFSQVATQRRKKTHHLVLMGGTLLCALVSGLSLPTIVPENLDMVMRGLYLVGLILIALGFYGWADEPSKVSVGADRLDRTDSAAAGARSSDGRPIDDSAAIRELKSQLDEMKQDITFLDKLQSNFLRTSPSMVLLLSENLNVKMTNPHFRNYFKLMPEEDVGQNIETLIPNKELMRAIRESIGNPGVREIAFQHYVKKSGDRQLKAWVCGEQKEMVVVALEEAATAVEGASRLPKTQIINLQSEKLQLAGGLLEEMMESMTPLVNELSAKSHTAASRGDLPGDARGELATIHGIGKALSRILKTFQSFAEKHLEKLEEVNVVAAIEEALDPKNYPYDIARVDIIKEFGLKRPKIEGSKVQLKQAITNLITNAIEATQGIDRNPVVEIHVNEDAGKVEIAVVDNGTGLSQENLKLALKGEYSKKSDKGGMGLSVTRRIVYGHKGNLIAESREGEGSAFFLHLPAK